MIFLVMYLNECLIVAKLCIALTYAWSIHSDIMEELSRFPDLSRSL